MKKYLPASLSLFLLATVSSISFAADEQLVNLLSLEEGTLPVVAPFPGRWRSGHGYDQMIQIRPGQYSIQQ